MFYSIFFFQLGIRKGCRFLSSAILENAFRVSLKKDNEQKLRKKLPLVALANRTAIQRFRLAAFTQLSHFVRKFFESQCYAQ
jgi:hypothetical protein